MQHSYTLAEGFRFKVHVLFLFTGVACGFLFLSFTRLSSIWAILCTFGMVIPFVAIITGRPERLLLGLLILCIPFNIDKSFFLHPEHTGGAVGLSISIWEFSLFLLVAIWISGVLFKKDQEIHFLTKWSTPVFCIIGFGLLSILKSSSMALSIFEIVQLAKVYLLFFFIANYIKTERHLKYVILFLFIAFFLECTLGLFQYFSGRSFDLAVLGGGKEKFARTFATMTSLRIPGTFGSSNEFGSYLIMLLPLLLSLAIFTPKRTHKLLYSSLLLMGVILLILTLSRGAWVGFVASIIVILTLIFAKSTARLKTLVMGGLFLIAVGILIFTFSENILLRFYGDDHGSAISRIAMMRTAFEMIKANPFLGVGINNYCQVMANYDSTGLSHVYLHPVHNVYLQIAAEIGVLGLGVFLWFIFMLYREALRNFKKAGDYVSTIRTGLIGGITALLVHSLVNNGSLADDIFILFWFLSGLLVATINMFSKLDKGNDL